MKSCILWARWLIAGFAECVRAAPVPRQWRWAVCALGLIVGFCGVWVLIGPWLPEESAFKTEVGFPENLGVFAFLGGFWMFEYYAWRWAFGRQKLKEARKQANKAQ